MANVKLSPEEIYSLLSQHNGDLNARDDNGVSVILMAANRHGDHIFSPNFPLLNYLLEREEIPRIDKIGALEMAGAVILGDDVHPEMFPLAFQCWRRALALRLQDIDHCRPIYKEPTRSKSGQLSEWSTLDDLLRIEKDPAQYKIQSLLVRLRISSSLCWAAVCDCFCPHFEAYAKSLPHERTIWSYHILDLCWTTLDTLLRSQRPHEKSLVLEVENFDLLVIELFRHLPKGHVNLNSTNFEKFVELLLMADLPYSTSNSKSNPSNLLNLYQMVEILSTHRELITEEIQFSLLRLVHRDGRNSEGFNLLHTACRFIQPSYLSLILFLVQLGADPNARVLNNHGYGVLHIQAVKPESEARDAEARLLLEHGAHLDMADNFGRTAADYWLRLNNQERHRLPDWLQEGVPKLKCLCSRVIRRHRLPYEDEAILPVVLIPFVTLH